MQKSNVARRPGALRWLLLAGHITIVIGVIEPVAAAPPPNWVTTMYNSADNTASGATIRVDVATTGRYRWPNGWGGAISGIYYRSSPADDWSENMIDDTDVGQLLQVSLYEGPPSAYFASSDLASWPWNPVQGGDAYGNVNWQAWIVGSGLSPVPWISIRTWPYDWANRHEDCVELDQTVYMYENHIRVDYTVSGRPWHSCSHPAMFHESPVLYTSRYDPNPLEVGKVYTGINPWTGDTSLATVAQDPGWHQVYASEDWIGLYRSDGGSGLALAWPERTLHQPYCHHWSFYLDDAPNGNTQIRCRPYFDFNPGTGEQISWTACVIPGDLETGRRIAYSLLPHNRWEFSLGEEGWVPWYQVSNLRAIDGKLKGTSTGTDPHILSLDQLDFASDPIWGLKVRMAVSVPPGTPQSRKAQVFYTTYESQTFSEDKSTGKVDTTADGVFRTYTWQLNTIPGWDGNSIKRLRFDPVDARTTTDGIQIDYIRLVHYEGEWEFVNSRPM